MSEHENPKQWTKLFQIVLLGSASPPRVSGHCQTWRTTACQSRSGRQNLGWMLLFFISCFLPLCLGSYRWGLLWRSLMKQFECIHFIQGEPKGFGLRLSMVGKGHWLEAKVQEASLAWRSIAVAGYWLPVAAYLESPDYVLWGTTETGRELVPLLLVSGFEILGVWTCSALPVLLWQGPCAPHQIGWGYSHYLHYEGHCWESW